MPIREWYKFILLWYSPWTVAVNSTMKCLSMDESHLQGTDMRPRHWSITTIRYWDHIWFVPPCADKVWRLMGSLEWHAWPAWYTKYQMPPMKSDDLTTLNSSISSRGLKTWARALTDWPWQMDRLSGSTKWMYRWTDARDGHTTAKLHANSSQFYICQLWPILAFRIDNGRLARCHLFSL